ncbi:MAG TPA: thiamine phosphate synthase [Syntrophales bacterium]|nr:thiamine phosphate synthase [Syntrophales bacterium]HQG34527.1 thiamine phosphate synthase [Syntrophales bacterium]HRR47861.1 thiamine phosphate synthase [Syntrophales bacterium]HRU89213.1 thiamine phosphate synthase [Syntrophales bacterium]
MQGLYLVTDRDLCGGRPLQDVVRAAVAGGAAWVQLREKNLSTRAFVEEAAAVKALLAPHKVPLIINDRLDVALAVGADGVHVGQDDMPYPLARAVLGKKMIIGLSVETWEDVEAAEKWDVDYLGVSPVFATPTKTDTKGSWGLEGITRIRSFSRHPLVAIGGLNATNTGAAVRAGADGIAVVSAICAAPDPFAAARELCRIIGENRQR